MARWTAIGLACLVAACCSAADDRIGVVDDCSNADGWEKGTWPGITGMESITTDGRQTSFTTLNGTFMTGASAAWAPDWPDWDKNADAGLAMISRKYPGTVDLDRYHYLVARMTYSGTYMALAVNGWDTKVCYTTGLHAVDLRDLDKPNLRGTQPIQLRLTFLNTQGKVTLDEIRLVDQLTPEEQAGFIPAGLDLRLQRLEPRPYHGLEALNARSGAPVRFDLPNEAAAFRDTSTGALVWRLTRTVRTEMADSFSPDGSALPIYNRSFHGMVVWDFDAGGMRELPDLRGAPVFSRADPSVIYLLQASPSGEQIRYVVQAANFRTGEVRPVADWLSSDGGSTEFSGSVFSDLLVVGPTGGRAMFLIDPRVADPAQRVRRVPLGMRMKGACISHHDQRVNWQRCYYFQGWQMDLATGQVQLGCYPTYGGHEIYGGDTIVGRYVSLLLSHRLGMLPMDEAHSDEVKVWSNWTADVPSDYGQLGPDGRWLCTNGTDREVAGKRLLIDGNESGTVLQVVHDFTSRNSWDSNTYTRISPDATKLAYMCDMLGDTDVYLAITRRPAAPRSLTLSREGNAARLRWEPPAVARELAGYNVYRSTASGRDYRRVNQERIAGTEFLDPAPPAGACYAGVAEEHSCGSCSTAGAPTTAAPACGRRRRTRSPAGLRRR
ncbi:MAG: fibronectin type III domain-containing protein [Armatimonadetes bacterium]|nr:fibronectin type III domain-containing protein [Armatimonadota bacterium]